MRDLASEFSKIVLPRTLTAGGCDPLLRPTPSPVFGRAQGTGVGTQTLVPLNFSAVVVPMSGSIQNVEWHQTSLPDVVLTCQLTGCAFSI